MTAEYTPLPRLFLDAVERFANPRAQMYRTAAGWRAISAGEMLRRVAGLAKALAALGIRSGDRVGIFAPNCPEWHEADFAIQGLGAVVVPVYFRESPERLTYILKDSGARIAFTAGEEQSSKLAECRQNLPTLEHVISTAGADDFSNATPDAERGSAPRYNTLRYQDLIAAAGEVEIADYRRRAAEVTSNQLATIIYTSGTTGEPKGVMLSHANLSSNSRDFTGDFELSPADVALVAAATGARLRADDRLRKYFPWRLDRVRGAAGIGSPGLDWRSGRRPWRRCPGSTKRRTRISSKKAIANRD